MKVTLQQIGKIRILVNEDNQRVWFFALVGETPEAVCTRYGWTLIK